MIKIPRDVRSHVCNLDIHTGGTDITVSLPTIQLFLFVPVNLSKDFIFVCSSQSPRGEGSRNPDLGSALRQHKPGGRV
jgi:hypothetical protein